MAENKLNGIIIKVVGGFYYVEADNIIYECKARGFFRKKGLSPVCGDRVSIILNNEGYPLLSEIYERKNSLIRPAMANIDCMCIVVSTVDPSPNFLIIDKMLATAENKNIEPVIIFTKNDIKTLTEFEKIYNKVGYKVFSVNYEANDNFDEIKSYLKGKTVVFTGNSGVGKSTLLNHLYPFLSLETGDISKKLGRGRHTTRVVELFKTEDGYFADSPGFSTLDIERYELIDKDELKFCFKEFKSYLDECQFTSCSHICEKGCSIIEAVKNGEISKSRHNSYITMYNEVKDIKQWNKKKINV